MSETSTTQIHLLNLTARPVQLRVSLHPGIRDYFRDGGSHKRFSARIREVLNAYFFAHAGVDDIRKYLGPYEHLPEKLEQFPGIVTVQTEMSSSGIAPQRHASAHSPAEQVSQDSLFSEDGVASIDINPTGGRP